MPASQRKSTREAAQNFRALLIELPLYAALVVGYFFAVLHFIGGWLGDLKLHHNTTYAFVCILLIIGQAVVL
ncbi:MAG TPA: hypothetical protein VGC85_11190, partial [Chthoniobacterales bacterium]